MSINSPEKITSVSCCSTKSRVRLTYITNESNNCAIISSWSASKSSGKANEYPTKRYLPPNTKHVIESAIHSNSNLCAILSQPVEDGPSHYVLSLISLPCNDSDDYNLLWQRHIYWDLFSSSETHPVVAFSSQGRYIVFGSTERLGVVGIDKTSCIFDPMPNNNGRGNIDAFLMHHEFLFLLDENGTRLRIFDVSDCNTQTVAEGIIPWSITLTPRHEKVRKLVRLHHSYEKLQQQLCSRYQIAFCGGRIWISGFYKFDLICSGPQLLRRLRSRLSLGGEAMSLQFSIVKNDLKLAPKVMYVWKDVHLYLVDSTKIYCWKATNANRGLVGNQLTTLVSGSDYIESIYCDGTKLIAATNCTFRNTTTRDWDGSGCITVIPIDAYEAPCTEPHSNPTLSALQTQTNQKLQLTNPKPHSPLLQLHNSRFFKHDNFLGRTPTPNTNGTRLHRHPISTSTNSNYQILDMFSEDGRFLIVRCKKGDLSKIVVFDLYSM